MLAPFCLDQHRVGPRRPQNFQDFAAERGNSIVDHRHRLSLALVDDLPYFKQGNWLKRNFLGNWELAPIHTFQSRQWVTAQDGIDANLNGDSAPDRPIFNATGQPGTGSGVIPLRNNTVTTCPGTVSAAAANPVGVVAYRRGIRTHSISLRAVAPRRMSGVIPCNCLRSTTLM